MQWSFTHGEISYMEEISPLIFSAALRIFGRKDSKVELSSRNHNQIVIVLNKKSSGEESPKARTSLSGDFSPLILQNKKA